MKKNLIFDLDGTLIDSAPSILEGYAYAFEKMEITPLRPLSTDIIGPPLMETLTQLSGQQDDRVLQKLASYFKEHYDTEGYKKTVVYNDIEQLLSELKAADFTMYIATNKRYNPTKKIIQHLGWDNFFDNVFALDYVTPALSSKAKLLAEILSKLQLDIEESIYIGDRHEDGLASDHNKLDFVMVTWGYLDGSATSPNKPHWQQCTQVNELANFFK